MESVKKRIEKLRKEIDYHRYLYHVLDREEISDGALDSLKHELTRLETEYPELITPDSPTQRVGGKPLPGFKKVRHSVPMLSLNDAFSEEEIAEWEVRTKKLLPPDIAGKIDYFAELKVDGFAVSLQYERGLFKSGSTRGDGIIGEDVTENLRTIESIPLRLPDQGTFGREKRIREILKRYPRVKTAITKVPPTLEVRGEVYMTKSAFAAVNREQEKKGLPSFANPRNIAAGSVRQLDPRMAASRSLDFLAWQLVTNLGQETHEEEHLIATCLGFRTVDLVAHCKNRADIMAFWKQILDKRDSLPFLIDGIVVQVNDRAISQRLGVVGKTPRAMIAFKFPAEEATTNVEDIIVQVGRTGVLTPVAILKPIEVGGVTVSRATLHNMDEIERLDVRRGDTVIVQRAGDVIPAVLRVLKNLRPRTSKPFRMPRRFCGQPVLRNKGEVAHRIAHPEACDLVQRGRFYHFVSRKAFDIIGLGPKIIDRLLEEGIIQDPADLFHLHEGDLKPLERFAEKSAANLVRAIQSRKTIPLSHFIYSLGILHVGEETALDLARHFGTLKALCKASEEILEEVPNIGSVVAKSIAAWLSDPHNKALIKKMLAAGIRPLPERKPIGRQPLKAKTFVLTGTLETLTRDEAKNHIRSAGGTVSESVSAKTDYVVTGTDPGSKAKEAEKRGIPRISEQEFLKLLDKR